MALQIKSAKRKFVFNNSELADPGNDLSPDEVMNFYADRYPDLTNGSVDAGELSDDGETVVYNMKVNVGSKG